MIQNALLQQGVERPVRGVREGDTEEIESEIRVKGAGSRRI